MLDDDTADDAEEKAKNDVGGNDHRLTHFHEEQNMPWSSRNCISVNLFHWCDLSGVRPERLPWTSDPHEHAQEQSPNVPSGALSPHLVISRHSEDRWHNVSSTKTITLEDRSTNICDRCGPQICGVGKSTRCPEYDGLPCARSVMSEPNIPPLADLRPVPRDGSTTRYSRCQPPLKENLGYKPNSSISRLRDGIGIQKAYSPSPQPGKLAQKPDVFGIPIAIRQEEFSRTPKSWHGVLLEIVVLVTGAVASPPVQWLLLQSLHLEPPSRLDQRIVSSSSSMTTLIRALDHERLGTLLMMFSSMAMTVVCLVKGATRTTGNARSLVYIVCFFAIVSGGIVWTSVGGSAVEFFWIFMPFALSVGVLLGLLWQMFRMGALAGQ